ncbi:MAG: hypothetical protein V1809_13115 [Planctomycetota bacterium]
MKTLAWGVVFLFGVVAGAAGVWMAVSRDIFPWSSDREVVLPESVPGDIPSSRPGAAGRGPFHKAGAETALPKSAVPPGNVEQAPEEEDPDVTREGVAREVAGTEKETDSSRRLERFVKVGRDMAGKEPHRLLSFLLTMDDGPEREALVTGLFSAWGGKDAVTAALYIAAVPEGDSRKAAARALAGVWATDNPNEAAEWVEVIPSGSERDGALDGLADRWAGLEPAGAVVWAESLPRADEVARMSARVFASWVARDADAAAKCLEAMPPGGARNAALRPVAMALAPKDPDRVRRWLAWLPEDERKAVLAETGLTE